MQYFCLKYVRLGVIVTLQARFYLRFAVLSPKQSKLTTVLLLFLINKTIKNIKNTTVVVKNKTKQNKQLKKYI